MTPLPPKRRSELRAEAHSLSPVVIIGDKGLTDEVVAEIDRSLKAHELIKVRAATNERDARDLWMESICERLQAHPVQQIGKVFVLYRENPETRETDGGRRNNEGGGAKREEDRRRPRAAVVTKPGKVRQRSRDLDKRREADLKDMVRKGKIKPEVEVASTTRRRGTDTPPEEGEGLARASTRTSRPRSRTPSARPASGPPKRRPRTSR